MEHYRSVGFLDVVGLPVVNSSMHWLHIFESSCKNVNLGSARDQVECQNPRKIKPKKSSNAGSRIAMPRDILLFF
jgi:hypothetical protein